MTVSELVELLKTYPQDLQVGYCKHSEHILLESDDISIKRLTVPREDGWIQNLREDMPSQVYLILPGN